jgi:ectoine hydroxylase-related dioxygenase (phytanoyl-CoA dioxygenase family)
MNSYKIYKNCITKKSSKDFFKFVVNLIDSYEKDFGTSSHFSNWNDLNFSKKLIKLRKKKEIFSAIYNSLLKSNELQKIVFNNNLHKLAGNFLNVDETQLTIRSITFRMDPPNDKRNLYGWHQDSAYDKFNFYSKNGAILWIPLIDTTKKNGTLMIKEGSEDSNYNCSKVFKKRTNLHSKKILVQKKYLKKYKSKHISVKKNNALVTYNGLFHKSGTNTSKKFRFTIVIRYGNLFAKDFIYRRNLKTSSIL